MTMHEQRDQKTTPVTEDTLKDVTRELLRIQDAVTRILERIGPCADSRDGEVCILGWHRGHHRTAAGVEWLDS